MTPMDLIWLAPCTVVLAVVYTLGFELIHNRGTARKLARAAAQAPDPDAAYAAGAHKVYSWNRKHYHRTFERRRAR